MADDAGKTVGYVSVGLGAITFVIELLGGLCCGWIAWPLGLAAAITGIVAITRGARGLGIAGIVLSVAAIAIQLLGMGATIGALKQQ